MKFFYVTGTILDSEDISVNMSEKVSVLTELIFYVGKQTSSKQ